MEALFSAPARMLARFGAGGRAGMAALTDILARAELDYAHLPYDADVLNQALVARARGEKIFLVAGRFANHAAGIAAHLGFDGVVTPADLAAGDHLPFDRASIERIEHAQPQPRQPEDLGEGAAGLSIRQEHAGVRAGRSPRIR